MMYGSGPMFSHYEAGTIPSSSLYTFDAQLTGAIVTPCPAQGPRASAASAPTGTRRVNHPQAVWQHLHPAAGAATSHRASSTTTGRSGAAPSTATTTPRTSRIRAAARRRAHRRRLHRGAGWPARISARPCRCSTRSRQTPSRRMIPMRMSNQARPSGRAREGALQTDGDPIQRLDHNPPRGRTATATAASSPARAATSPNCRWRCTCCTRQVASPPTASSLHGLHAPHPGAQSLHADLRGA